MPKDALLLVDKPQGITSFDCLGKIKRNLNRKTGHCGTLDKFAHGLMIVLCGCYTHLVPVFMGMDKVYEALIEFGKSTSTLDPEGQITEQEQVPDEQTVRRVVGSYLGNQIQIPPIYSAIHVNGKRSYDLARSGEAVELKGREVTIHSAEILNWEAPFLKVRLHVSKGTYIRSYARDIGHMCGSCAYVKELYRTKIGPFRVDEAFPYDDVDSMAGYGGGEELLRRLEGCIELEVSDEEAFRASNGYIMASVLDRIPKDASFAIIKGSVETVCIYSVKEGHIICQVRHGK